MRSQKSIIALGAVCLAAIGPAAPAGAGAAKGSADQLAKRTTRDLNRVIVEARDQLAQLARLPSVKAQNVSACKADMVARAGSSRYTAFGAANLDGDLYCLSSGLTSPINIIDRAYFLRALGEKGLGVGDYQIGRSTGLASLGLGYAVLAGQRAVGIVLSPISLSWLDGRIERRFEAPAVEALVIDDHGTVLAQAGGRGIAVGTNLARLALVKAMLAERAGEGTFRLSGRRIDTAFRTVPASTGAVHVAVGVRP